MTGARARALGERCEGAMLVAAGLSNKDIASRLTVSVRTVEGHLYRACNKLHVTDRVALATQLAGRHAEPGKT